MSKGGELARGGTEWGSEQEGQGSCRKHGPSGRQDPETARSPKPHHGAHTAAWGSQPGSPRPSLV